MRSAHLLLMPLFLKPISLSINHLRPVFALICRVSTYTKVQVLKNVSFMAGVLFLDPPTSLQSLAPEEMIKFETFLQSIFTIRACVHICKLWVEILLGGGGAGAAE